jgi:hypothetical protein
MKQDPSTCWDAGDDAQAARSGRWRAAPSLFSSASPAWSPSSPPGLYARLAAGPLSFNGLPDRVAGALAERIGSAGRLPEGRGAPARQARPWRSMPQASTIRNPQGAGGVRAPEAVVSVG